MIIPNADLIAVRYQGRILTDNPGKYISSRFRGVTGIEPGEKATLKRLDLIETIDQQEMRRTGARFLIQSGAVKDVVLERIQVIQP